MAMVLGIENRLRVFSSIWESIMAKFVRSVKKILRDLCVKRWEQLKRLGGAFLGVFVDYATGKIWFDTMELRLPLAGYIIGKNKYGNWDIIKA